jgi:general L-amino acid transport system substrate-binding protein
MFRQQPRRTGYAPRRSAAALLALCLLAAAPARADMGETLVRIRSRGAVLCGVTQGQAGFSKQGPDGVWHGLDADFCRAVAAAALGDASRVRFVPLQAAYRFPALQLGEVDLLARTTTWTVEREAAFGVVFAGVIYFDEQKVLARRDSPVTKPGGLNGAKVCVVQGTNLPGALQTYARAHGWEIILVHQKLRADAVRALIDGTCDAYTSDFADIVQARAEAGSAFDVLPDDITREPLGPAVRWNDDQWLVLVRAVLAALIDAEARGLTQKLATDGGAITDAMSRATAGFASALRIDPRWALRAVAAAGNYGEMFDRDVGAGSELKLDRGRNRLWKNGGLMWAPPLQ